MAPSIPDFAERVAPLRDILENAFSKAMSRKKKAIDYMKLESLCWGPIQKEAFLSLPNSPMEAVKLSHRDHSKTLCIFTDASDLFWAGVVTQCDSNEMASRAMNHLDF